MSLEVELRIHIKWKVHYATHLCVAPDYLFQNGFMVYIVCCIYNKLWIEVSLFRKPAYVIDNNTLLLMISLKTTLQNCRVFLNYMYYYFIYSYMHFGMEWWEKRNRFLLWTLCVTRVFCLHNVYISLSSGIILIKIHYCELWVGTCFI